MAASRESSEHSSLNSSSVITPSVRVKGATPQADSPLAAAAMLQSRTQSTEPTTVSAVTSPRSVLSELVDAEYVSSAHSAVEGPDDEDDDFVLLSDEDDDDFADIASVSSST